MATDKKEMSGLISPANLWGKPLPRALSKPITDERTEMKDDADFDDSDDDNEDEEVVTTTRRRRDVRAEMADVDDPTDEDLRAAETEEEEEETDDDEDEFLGEAGDEGDEGDEGETGEGADETEETEDGFAYAEDNSDDATAELDDGDEPESDEIGAAVAADDDDGVTASVTSTKKGTAMAETKKKSISDHVRDEIERRRKSGDSLRGVDIVTALAARKITVSPAQVSQLLKKAGIAPKARGPRKAKEAAATEERSRSANKATPKKVPEKPATGPSRPAPARGPLLSDESFSFQLPVAQLQAAEKFVTACGSLKKAEQILTLAAQLAAEPSRTRG